MKLKNVFYLLFSICESLKNIPLYSIKKYINDNNKIIKENQDTEDRYNLPK